MKKLIAWLISWSLYWFGDAVSRLLNLDLSEKWADFWYPIYNRSMVWSSQVQDWADGRSAHWPWELPPGE